LKQKRGGGAGDAGGSENRPYWRRFEGGARVGYFRAKALLLALLYVASEGATYKAFCAGRLRPPVQFLSDQSCWRDLRHTRFNPAEKTVTAQLKRCPDVNAAEIYGRGMR